jgi:energy-coupling factor transport system substrate-specific component
VDDGAPITDQHTHQHAGPWDGLLAELHAVRRRAGEPSYAEIARRVSERRRAAGADEHAARIAKSSVHDAFRMGRSRINVELTREIVEALGEDPGLVDRWLQPEQPEPAERPEEDPHGPTGGQVALLVLACTAVNLLGREFVDLLQLPIYLDMLGTAVAAVVLGPWRGAGVGLATNVVGILGSGWVSLPFAAVNVAGALVWGYGVHRWGMGRTLPRFMALNVLAAFVCSVVAVPIIATLFGNDIRVGHDAITQLVSDSVDSFAVSLSFSNLLTSLTDKLICGFVTLVAVFALRRGVPLVVPEGPRG